MRELEEERNELEAKLKALSLLNDATNNTENKSIVVTNKPKSILKTKNNKENEVDNEVQFSQNDQSSVNFTERSKGRKVPTTKVVFFD